MYVLSTDGVEEEDVTVIPQKIEKSSIRTVGPWHDFNLTWSSDLGINHGTVFYKLFLQIGRDQIRQVRTFFFSEALTEGSVQSIIQKQTMKTVLIYFSLSCIVSQDTFIAMCVSVKKKKTTTTICGFLQFQI
jgi:hypothetical protein